MKPDHVPGFFVDRYCRGWRRWLLLGHRWELTKRETKLERVVGEFVSDRPVKMLMCHMTWRCTSCQAVGEVWLAGRKSIAQHLRLLGLEAPMRDATGAEVPGVEPW